jgi:amidase
MESLSIDEPGLEPSEPADLEPTALELAAAVRERRVSAEELAWDTFDAIRRLDPVVSAFVDVLEDDALRAAAAIDRRLRKREPALPPFLGVPIGIKDLNAVRGSFTRFGSRAFERLFTPFDDASASRLRKAGFVIVGKTATSELGALPITETDIHPPTRNPWDLGVTPGGSSGGAAAAVAAGMLAIAHGNDAGGSIRIPSSLCHLFGLKPSRGRVENPYGLEDGATLVSCGPIARTVDDAAAMLDALAGTTVGKPHWAPQPPAPFLELARRAPRRLRVRFATSHPHVTIEPAIAAAVARLARTVASLGHDVDEGPFCTGSIDDYLPLWQRLMAMVPVPDWSVVQPVTRWLAEAGRDVTEEDAARMQVKASREVLAWFGDVDIWITPTVPVSPPRVGALRGLAPRDAFHEAAKLGMFTAPFNASGQPAASVPIGLTDAGHPIGAQVVGRPLADGTVLALCKQIEAALPWRGRRPPAIPNERAR